MSQFAWPEQVTTLSNMLNTLEGEVTRGDHERTQLVGVQERARRAAAPDLEVCSRPPTPMIPTRFKSSSGPTEGTEMCRALTTDLQTGKLSSRPPDLPALRHSRAGPGGGGDGSNAEASEAGQGKDVVSSAEDCGRWKFDR